MTEIERLRGEMAAIATAVLSADVAYPGGCNLNELGKLVELVRYLAKRAEEREECSGVTLAQELDEWLGATDPPYRTRIEIMAYTQGLDDAIAMVRRIEAENARRAKRPPECP